VPFLNIQSTNLIPRPPNSIPVWIYWMVWVYLMVLPDDVNVHCGEGSPGEEGGGGVLSPMAL